MVHPLPTTFTTLTTLVSYFFSFSAFDAAVLCLIGYFGWRIYLFVRSWRLYGWPDMIPAFAPMSLPGMLFGLGLNFTWSGRKSLYTGKSQTLRLTPWLWGDTILYTRSVEVQRQVAGGGSNHTWVKPDWSSQALTLWGPNLISENLEPWRKHRRVMQPAFNNKTYELVWQETSRIYDDMVSTEKWTKVQGTTISLPSINEFTFKLGLYVIGACGFGLPFSWAEPPKSKSGKASIQSNLETVEKWYLMIMYAPKWIWRFPSKVLRGVWEEYVSLRSFINAEIAQRKFLIRDAIEHDIHGGDYDSVKKDVFSRLVLASETDGKYGMSDIELIGDSFAVLLAGHDTTAASIAAAIGLLAVHQEEQAKVFGEIARVIDEDGELSFAQFGKLKKTLNVFLEAVRMYPAGHSMIRTCTEDAILRLSSSNGSRAQDESPLPKDSTVIVDVIGIQYNPQVYEDPYMFKPSRWEGVGEDGITSFGIGPRTCIGKKFAMTEAVCFLANLLRDWRIDPLLKAGETVDGWKSRVLSKTDITLTLSIATVPVNLTRR